MPNPIADNPEDADPVNDFTVHKMRDMWDWFETHYGFTMMPLILGQIIEGGWSLHFGVTMIPTGLPFPPWYNDPDIWDPTSPFFVADFEFWKMRKPSYFSEYQAMVGIDPETGYPILDTVIEEEFGSLDEQTYFVEIEIPRTMFDLARGTWPEDIVRMRGYYIRGNECEAQHDRGLLVFHGAAGTRIAQDGYDPMLGFLGIPKGYREFLASFALDGWDVLYLDKPAYGYLEGSMITENNHIHSVLDVFGHGVATDGSGRVLRWINVTDVEDGDIEPGKSVVEGLPAPGFEDVNIRDHDIIVGGQSQGGMISSIAMYHNYEVLKDNPNEQYNLKGAILLDIYTTPKYNMADFVSRLGLDGVEGSGDEIPLAYLWILSAYLLKQYEAIGSENFMVVPCGEVLGSIDKWPGYLGIHAIQDFITGHVIAEEYNRARGLKRAVLCEGHHAFSMIDPNLERVTTKSLKWADRLLKGRTKTNNRLQTDMDRLLKRARYVENITGWPSN